MLIRKDLREEHPKQCAAEYDREDSEPIRIAFIRFSALLAAVPAGLRMLLGQPIFLH